MSRCRLEEIQPHMIILGIDPGVATTGWGVIQTDESMENGLKMLEYGAIITSSSLPHQERLGLIYKEIREIIMKYRPSQVSIERLFFCKNLKTAMAVGEARGVILLSLQSLGLGYREFTPLQIKQAVCGYGKADKKQVQSMVKSILFLEEEPKPDDAADGLAAAVCCAFHYGTESAIKNAV